MRRMPLYELWKSTPSMLEIPNAGFIDHGTVIVSMSLHHVGPSQRMALCSYGGVLGTI